MLAWVKLQLVREILTSFTRRQRALYNSDWHATLWHLGYIAKSHR